MDLFVHITGSVPRECGSDAIALTKRTAYETARALLREKIGVVALVGATPNENTMPFDDEIIKRRDQRRQVLGKQGRSRLT